ncbi:MAG: transposase [bacterium]|nr:transposase [bacterium]
MATREPCVTDEWYHCYNRGVDKRRVFGHRRDYERFMSLLYLSNGTKAETVSERFKVDLQSILADKHVDRGEQLVDIGAFALMPTHVHLLLRQLQDNGIARFMQKVFTGYTMYFNSRNDRTGSLFSGTYKAKHIRDDRYLKQVVPYILLNPAELFAPEWKRGKCDIRMLRREILAYPYASVDEFFHANKTGLGRITTASIKEYYDALPSFGAMLRDARAYYADLPPEV